MKKLLTFVGMFCIVLNSYALQALEAVENVPLKAQISTKEMSRIAIDGGKITNLRFLDGELDLQKDDVNGQVFVKSNVKKTVNLFIASDAGRNYLLQLEPSLGQADSILIKEKTAIEMRASLQDRAPRSFVQSSETFIRTIKRFALAIANEGVGFDEVMRAQAGYEVPLWREVIFVKDYQYSSPELIGDVYQLRNASSSPMVLSEQEFYKKNVIAVVVKKQTLAPGESTRVYIISKNQGD